MRRFAVAAVLPLLAVVLTGASGCVSAAKYRDLEAAHRNQGVRLEQAETELQAERAKARELAAKLDAARSELAAKDSQIAALQDARDRLKAAYEALRAEYDKLGQQPVTPVVITKNVLPPALNKALLDFEKQHPGMVEYDPTRGLLKWKSDLLFDLGSAQLKPAALPALADFANILKSAAADGFDIMIAGHTDNTRIAREATRREHPTNWHLSAHRAISVLFELIKDGVSPERQTVMGYGEYQPVVPNTSDANKAQNRRVEIYLTKKGTVPGSAPAPEMAQTAVEASEQPAAETPADTTEVAN